MRTRTREPKPAVRAWKAITDRTKVLIILNRERNWALEARDGFGARRAEIVMAVVRAGAKRVIFGGAAYTITNLAHDPHRVSVADRTESTRTIKDPAWTPPRSHAHTAAGQPTP